MARQWFNCPSRVYPSISIVNVKASITKIISRELKSKSHLILRQAWKLAPNQGGNTSNVWTSHRSAAHIFVSVIQNS